MEQKPIIRWTIGDPHKAGKKALKCSVKAIRKLYKEKFELVICHNGNEEEFPQVDRIINQRSMVENSLLYEPPDSEKCGTAWKLYPPRIDIERHEIFMDNDVILYKRLDQIDEFLSGDKFLTSEAITRSYGDRFDHLVKQGTNWNTGLLGLPPRFDLKREINKVLKKYPGKWESHFDEQAVFISIIQDKDNIMVTLKELQVVTPEGKFERGTHGIHFVGVNKGATNHWDRFNTIQLL